MLGSAACGVPPSLTSFGLHLKVESGTWAMASSTQGAQHEVLLPASAIPQHNWAFGEASSLQVLVRRTPLTPLVHGVRSAPGLSSGPQKQTTSHLRITVKHKNKCNAQREKGSSITLRAKSQEAKPERMWLVYY